jgi:hypothetical protein
MQVHGENVEGHSVLGTAFSFQKHCSSNNPSIYLKMSIIFKKKKH